MANKTTAWYPPDIKPVRKGWYACQQCTISRSWSNRHYWDGHLWLHNGPNGERVKVEFSWRGFTKRSYDASQPSPTTREQPK